MTFWHFKKVKPNSLKPSVRLVHHQKTTLVEQSAERNNIDTLQQRDYTKPGQRSVKFILFTTIHHNELFEDKPKGQVNRNMAFQ